MIRRKRASSALPPTVEASVWMSPRSAIESVNAEVPQPTLQAPPPKGGVGVGDGGSAIAATAPVGDGVAAGEGDGLGDGDGEGLGEGDGLGDGDGEGFGLGVGVDFAVGFGVGLFVGGGVRVT